MGWSELSEFWKNTLQMVKEVNTDMWLALLMEFDRLSSQNLSYKTAIILHLIHNAANIFNSSSWVSLQSIVIHL